MRQSRYDISMTTPNGEHLLFNSANGAFAVLSDAAFAALLSGEDVASGALAEAGFLTDNTPEDELATQQELFQRASTDHDELPLCLAPTYACNYRCPYCYEKGLAAKANIMGQEVQDAVIRYAERRMEAHRPSKLSIQWYGGDPSLCLDVVEALSRRLIALAERFGVAYDAMMLTNGNRIDADAADLIVRCRISSVMLTIDGPENLHNHRRVAADGSNSYRRVLTAARLLRARGVTLRAVLNADKVNWEVYPELKRQLLKEEGIELDCGKLNDYGHFFGSHGFCHPDFDLFTHEEFARAQHDLFVSQPYSADDLRELLHPYPTFCRGQLQDYAVIDPFGAVYDCDGWFGDADHLVGSVFEDGEDARPDAITFDATADPKCSGCELLPICQGSCIWERECTGMPCHPLKTTILDYLRDYRGCFDDGLVAQELAIDGVALLSPPLGDI